MIGYLLIFLIILLPLQFALNIGENFDLVVTRLLVPVIFLLWLVKGLAQKKIWIPNKAEMWLVISFLFLSAISLFLGWNADAGIRKLVYFLTIFPVFFVAANVFRKGKWQKTGIKAIVLSGTMASLIALAQFSLPFVIGLEKSIKIWESMTPYVLGNSFGKIVAANSSWLVNIVGMTKMRAFGLFPDPHNFAFFVNICLFVGIGYLFSQKKALSATWIGVATVLMVVAVGLSFSRGAYLGLFMGGIIFALIYLKRSGMLGKVIVVCGAIFVFVLMFNSNIVTQRLASSFNLKEGSNAERYKNWVQAVRMIQENPLSGVGLGNYARAIESTSEDRSSIYAHNLFLDIAAETGILNAFVAFLLILASIWRNIKSNSTINLGIAAALAGFLVHSIFDTALYSPQVLVMILMILALGLFPINLREKIENGETIS